MNKATDKNSEVTIDKVADAANNIQKLKIKKDPIEKTKQDLAKRQLTVSYKGIYG